jgi:nucleotide-binding universal stress UspA family protein
MSGACGILGIVTLGSKHEGGDKLPDSNLLARARQDFMQATRAAILRRLWARLTGQNDSLVPYEDLRKTLGLLQQRYRGVQPVPVDKIIGSMGRSGDFDRVFLPTQRHSRPKWVSVDSAFLGGVALPPVSLYKVGEAYFVVDGHHRVSVARQQGANFIDAEVIEVPSRVPVTADLSLEDLDVLAAYRDFLEQTKLDVLRPDQNARLTMPGDYVRLLDHIHVHKYFMDKEQGRELSWEEAVKHWYDLVYLPVVQTIRKYKLLRDFPGHTEADLYLWIIEHAYYLSQKLGQQVSPREVARDYVSRFSSRPRYWAERAKRYITNLLIPNQLDAGPPAGTWREERVDEGESAHLFRDILVTITGAESGWRALTQAAEFARREDSFLRGLHVAPSHDDQALEYGRRVLEEFTFRCGALGVRSSTSLAVGDVTQEIIGRARWADMVVINQRREHGRWAERPLGTIFQTVASQGARPILAVPGNEVRPLQRVLLAYDGSPKAREALFVLRHMVSHWHMEGVLLTVGSSHADREMLNQAWQYAQEGGGPPVVTRLEQGIPYEVILHVMEEKVDLLLMGGFGYQPLLKALMGSTVDHILREAWFPVLICR